jgi:MFS family permease
MVTWDIISAATMFVSGPTSFYALRLLLGAAEAGFFPGVILYLTYWFPQRSRGQILGLFYFGVPISFILGSPLSGSLLGMPTRFGIEGWQWMFLVEGLLAVAGGIGAFWYLNDRPASADWLSATEKEALLAQLSREELQRSVHGPSSSVASLKDPRVLQFSLIYFLIQAGVYGVIFYLPAEVSLILGKKAGLEVGLVSSIPWIVALGATISFARSADKHHAHRLLASAGLLVSGLAILIVPITGPALALCALCVAASGYIAIQPLFWTFPTGYLSGGSAAAGIAMINALGNLGGFVVPNIKVWAEVHFGSRLAGSVVLAGFTFLGALLIAATRNRKVSGGLPGLTL